MLRWRTHVPFALQQGSQTSSPVAAETWGSSLVVAGNSRFPLELTQGSQSSSRSAVGSGDSSEVAACDAGFHWSHGRELRVLELG